jgi:hypothetical protein
VTDARKIGEALEAEYTLLREFNSDELSRGISRFWDEPSISWVSRARDEPSLPGADLSIEVSLLALEPSSAQELFFRHATGGAPTWRLKARLKAASDSYPTRSATSAMERAD